MVIGVGESVMRGPDSARYRLRLAQGFLEEAREDVSLKRWRSAVDNAQLAVENAAKAVLALLGPIRQMHRVPWRWQNKQFL